MRQLKANLFVLALMIIAGATGVGVSVALAQIGVSCMHNSEESTAIPVKLEYRLAPPRLTVSGLIHLKCEGEDPEDECEFCVAAHVTKRRPERLR